LAFAQVAALCGLIALIGGIAVIAVPLAVVAAKRWPVAAQAVACGAVLAAGALTMLAANPIMPGSGAFGAPAQGCALLALTIALSPAAALSSDAGPS
jgi:arabinofuranan 3-O-arabinosyltransferase